MRKSWVVLALGLAITAGAGNLSFAADAAAVAPAGKVMVKASAKSLELRDYKVDVAITGSMPNPDTREPMKIDSVMAFKLRHRYIKRAGDGLLPMEIALLEGDVTMMGQSLRISPSIYPKLTVLLDKDFGIDDIFGFSETTPGALPGINYGNMAMLFHVPGLGQSRSVGENWESKVTLASLKEAYSVRNTLKAVSRPGEVPATVTVRQEFTRIAVPNSTTPPPFMKATVESVFAQEDGKLLKSHADCEVASTQSKDAKSQQDTSGHRANIKMDISLVK